MQIAARWYIAIHLCAADGDGELTAYHTNSFNLEQQVLLAQKAESLMKSGSRC